MLNSAVRLLDDAAKQYGDTIAIEDEFGMLTYKEYRDISRKIGSGLIRKGVDRGAVVVYMPKNSHALMCFMGAMYGGAPYVPIDDKMPIVRLEKIVKNLKPSAIIVNAGKASDLASLDLEGIDILTYETLIEEVIDDELIEGVLGQVIDTDPIYIMYTSGSTGAPKGVTIPHRGILDYATWLIDTFEFDQSVVMGNQAPFYFDNSTFDIYGCLKCGGKLVLIPELLFMFPNKLPEYINEKQITSLFWVPTVMINVANSGVLSDEPMPQLKNVAFCGEVMPNKQLNIWRQTHSETKFANLYGPTEITDVCCYYKVDRSYDDLEPLPIGKACENMKVLIINKDNQLAAVGEKGELCVLGSGVALGYWHAKEISEKVFVINPLNKMYDERMYKTGDLAFVNEEGLLMFCGRKDSQIKLKGNRIELGEIENAGMSLPYANNVCVIFDEEKQEIVLYVETSEVIVKRKVVMALKKLLPSYMIPSKIIGIEHLPYTDNDKIDRVTLKKMTCKIQEL